MTSVVATRGLKAVRILTRIREENPALWSRIRSFLRGDDGTDQDPWPAERAGKEPGDEADAGEGHA